MSKPIRGNTIVPCRQCKNQIDLVKVARIAASQNLREIRCPYCNHRMGQLS